MQSEATRERSPAGEPAHRRLGRYAIVGTLARGGMGEVLRARSFGAAGVAKELCIKRIHADRLAAPGALARFVAEAKVSLRLSHGNIVSVFDFGRAGNEYYLAMEWVDGADLRALTRAEGAPLSPMASAHVCAEVARALSYAHQTPSARADGAIEDGVVHCDVKPANILVSRSGDVKLADFGVSSAVAGGGGTRGYMPPEQERGEITPAADVYALGMVLGQLLTGRLQAPGLALEGAPEALSALFARATASDPAQRVQSAAELADVLDDFVAAERVAHGGSPRSELATHATRASSSPEAPDGGRVIATLSFAGESATLSQIPAAGGDAAMTPAPGRRATWVAALLVALALVASLVAFQHRGAEDGSAQVVAAADPDSDPLADSDPDSDPVTVTVTDPGSGSDSVTAPLTDPVPDSVAPPASDPPARPDAPSAEGSRRASRPPPPAPAILRINAIPWAEVELDGRALGTTPLLSIETTPGRHLLRFRNPALHAERTRDVELAAGEHRDVVVDLSE